MTREDIEAWMAQGGYTYDTAAQALGMSRSGFGYMLQDPGRADKRTALAMAAIVAGIEPWPAKPRAAAKPKA